ncbi:MAG: type II toxin-antitoxin system Phd/YefM family antitoxin [Pseudomonadota bacterium]
MTTISANSLKTQGIAAITEALADSPEALVSVRGKDRFVVMNIEHYHYLRECELAAALAESQADMAAGRFVTESVEAHLKRLATLQ